MTFEPVSVKNTVLNSYSTIIYINMNICMYIYDKYNTLNWAILLIIHLYFYRSKILNAGLLLVIEYFFIVVLLLLLK